MKKLTRGEARYLKNVSLVLVANCVRNTFLENLYAGRKFGNKEMKILMGEITNKVYTFLKYSDDREFMVAMDIYYPEDWSDPKLDKDFMMILKKLKMTEL